MWCYQDLTSIKWKVNFDQNIACKYVVVKCIDRHSQNMVDSNIDMFPLLLEGHQLKIPDGEDYR